MDEPRFEYRPPADGPTLLYLDADCVAVDKPGGLLSVPGREAAHRDSVVSRLEATVGAVWVVHRLDMDTSGVLIYARHREAAAALGRAFERRQTLKRYEALVHGLPGQQEGEIDLPLRLDWPHRPRQIVDAELGKPCLTRFRVIGPHGPLAPTAPQEATMTRVALQPITGRSHQLRVHLAAIGHPIVGDRFYGRADAATQPRLMLHAQRLEVPHPTTGAMMVFEAPVPF